MVDPGLPSTSSAEPRASILFSASAKCRRSSSPEGKFSDQARTLAMRLAYLARTSRWRCLFISRMVFIPGKHSAGRYWSSRVTVSEESVRLCLAMASALRSTQGSKGPFRAVTYATRRFTTREGITLCELT